VEIVASLSQGRTAAAQCSLFTYKSVPVIFEPPCTKSLCDGRTGVQNRRGQEVSSSLYTSIRALGCTPPPLQWVLGLFPEGKGLGH